MMYGSVIKEFMIEVRIKVLGGVRRYLVVDLPQHNMGKYKDEMIV